jgi:phosphoadenosine phosphosulfate reductase
MLIDKLNLKNDILNQLESLNKGYKDFSIHQKVEQLYKDFSQDDIMLTSSFAATSAMLIKVFSDVNKDQLIYFIDTGYHFKETIIYKDYLTKLYDLNVVDVTAEDWKHQFTTEDKTWTKDPDMCCSINKVEPLEKIKKKYKIWISGLMKWQSDHRESLDFF